MAIHELERYGRRNKNKKSMDDPIDITNFLFRGANFKTQETTYQLDSSSFVLHICSNLFFPTSQALEIERHNRNSNTKRALKRCPFGAFSCVPLVIGFDRSCAVCRREYVRTSIYSTYEYGTSVRHAVSTLWLVCRNITVARWREDNMCNKYG